ncbi:MAG TPA: CbiX/SirB N-terminal domain-containing protein [Verrucomicrobiae bacterium]|nr:CbiX/SirB N-terminal domain-containing protein [Verrucomicrobiae bacterium]
MPGENFSDAALIVLGHGSTKNDESSAPVYQHAGELRRRGIFADVREAFWKQEPQIKTVLGDATEPRKFIVPLFISEGYFSSEVIPKALGFLPGHSRLESRDGELFFCQPVGTHERMTSVLLSRASEVAGKFPFPRAPKPQETTLFIAGHGTEQNENSRKAIDRQVEIIRATNEYAAVHAVFLDEDPRIASCYELAQTKNIIVVPFFISDGMHVREDIPVLLGEPERFVKERLANQQPTWRNPTERNEKFVWYGAPVGTEPQIADVILERVREVVK